NCRENTPACWLGGIVGKESYTCISVMAHFSAARNERKFARAADEIVIGVCDLAQGSRFEPIKAQLAAVDTLAEKDNSRIKWVQQEKSLEFVCCSWQDRAVINQSAENAVAGNKDAALGCREAGEIQTITFKPIGIR